MESFIITKLLNHYLSADQQSIIVLCMAGVIICDRVLERLHWLKPNKTEQLVIGFVTGGLKALKGSDYVQNIDRAADGLIDTAAGAGSPGKLDPGEAGPGLPGSGATSPAGQPGDPPGQGTAS